MCNAEFQLVEYSFRPFDEMFPRNLMWQLGELSNVLCYGETSDVLSKRIPNGLKILSTYCLIQRTFCSKYVFFLIEKVTRSQIWYAQCLMVFVAFLFIFE